MSIVRPVPDDFTAQVEDLGTISRLRTHYSCSQGTIYRWLRLANIDITKLHRLTPMPSDLAELARTRCAKDLIKHYGVSKLLMKRWLTENGIVPAVRTKPRKEVPADFAEVAPTMHKAALERHYGASHEVVTRWLVESGARVAPTPLGINLPKGRKREIFDIRPSGGRGTNFAALRTTSVHDLAADEIRRQRFVVHRCDDRGRYAEKGDLWRVGMVVLDGDGLLARADRYRRRAA